MAYDDEDRLFKAVPSLRQEREAQLMLEDGDAETKKAQGSGGKQITLRDSERVDIVEEPEDAEDAYC